MGIAPMFVAVGLWCDAGPKVAVTWLEAYGSGPHARLKSHLLPMSNLLPLRAHNMLMAAMTPTAGVNNMLAFPNNTPTTGAYMLSSHILRIC